MIFSVRNISLYKLRWIAIILPNTTGLDYPLEVETFWVEHYMAGIINPIILAVSGR